MTGRGKAIMAALVLAGAFIVGWTAQGWRSDAALSQLRQDHAGVLAAIAIKTRAAADAVRAYERQAGLALAAADKKSTEDLNHAKAETQRLRDCVRTAQMLERVRAQLGGHAVIVTSGYRGREVNQAVGGATSSDHQAGQAADIQVPGFGKPYDVAKALVPHLDALGIGQLAYESDGASQWVHVSTRVQSKPVNRVITIAVGRGTYLGIQHV